MSLIESNRDVQRGVDMLNAATPKTYVGEAYEYNALLGVLAFLCLGFIRVAVSYAQDGFASYDKLCEKFAKKHIEIQENNGGKGHAALVKEQTQIFNELRGRVQNLTASMTGRNANADRTAVLQAAQYKLEQAICAARGMPTDGSNDQEEVIDEAKEVSGRLVADMGRRQVREAASEMARQPVDGAEERIAARAKALVERGAFSSVETAREHLEERYGDAVYQGTTGRAGERAFASRVKPLTRTQAKAAVDREVTKAVKTLKELVKARQETTSAHHKKEKAVTEQQERVDELQGQVDDLNTELEEANQALEAARNPEDGSEADESAVEQAERDVADVEARVQRQEDQLNNAQRTLARLTKELNKLGQAAAKAEDKYLEHLTKYFQIEARDERVEAEEDGEEPTTRTIYASDELDQEDVDALVQAGTIDEEDEGKLTFKKLPADKKIKEAVNRTAIEETVAENRDKDVALVRRVREEAADRANAPRRRRDEEVSLEERVARGVMIGMSAMARGPRSGDGSEDGSQAGDDVAGGDSYEAIHGREDRRAAPVARDRRAPAHDEDAPAPHVSFSASTRGGRSDDGADMDPAPFSMPSYAPSATAFHAPSHRAPTLAATSGDDFESAERAVRDMHALRQQREEAQRRLSSLSATSARAPHSRPAVSSHGVSGDEDQRARMRQALLAQQHSSLASAHAAPTDGVHE